MAQKCKIWEEDGVSCKNPVFIKIKVQVFHPNILRRTWQTWPLCRDHFEAFLNSNGEGWYVTYRYKPEKGECPVINFKLPAPWCTP